MKRVAGASVVASRPATITTTVPFGAGRNAWTPTRTATAARAVTTTAAQRNLGPGSGWGLRRRRPAIPGGHLVDVADAELRYGVAFDLEDVLGVLLTAVREVEAAGVHVVVGDQDLGVHEVMHGPGGVRGRALGAEAGGADDRLEGRDLPRNRRLVRPLVLDLVHLGRIVHTAKIEPGLRRHLGQRAQHRTGCDDRRAHANAAPRRRDRPRHRMHQLQAPTRTEIWAHARAVGQRDPSDRY